MSGAPVIVAVKASRPHAWVRIGGVWLHVERDGSVRADSYFDPEDYRNDPDAILLRTQDASPGKPELRKLYKAYVLTHEHYLPTDAEVTRGIREEDATVIRADGKTLYFVSAFTDIEKARHAARYAVTRGGKKQVVKLREVQPGVYGLFATKAVHKRMTTPIEGPGHYSPGAIRRAEDKDRLHHTYDPVWREAFGDWGETEANMIDEADRRMYRKAAAARENPKGKHRRALRNPLVRGINERPERVDRVDKVTTGYGFATKAHPHGAPWVWYAVVRRDNGAGLWYRIMDWHAVTKAELQQRITASRAATYQGYLRGWPAEANELYRNPRRPRKKRVTSKARRF